MSVSMHFGGYGRVYFLCIIQISLSKLSTTFSLINKTSCEISNSFYSVIGDALFRQTDKRVYSLKEERERKNEMNIFDMAKIGA